VTEIGQRYVTIIAHLGTHFGCSKVLLRLTEHFAFRAKHKPLRQVVSKAPLNTPAIVRRTTEHVSVVLLFRGTNIEC